MRWGWFEYGAVAVFFEHYQEDKARDAKGVDELSRARAYPIADSRDTTEKDRRDVG